MNQEEDDDDFQREWKAAPARAAAERRAERLDTFRALVFFSLLAALGWMMWTIWSINQRIPDIPERSYIPVQTTYETYIVSIPDVSVLDDELTTAELLKVYTDDALKSGEGIATKACRPLGQELVDVIAVEGEEHVFDNGDRTPTIDLIFICKVVNTQGFNFDN